MTWQEALELVIVQTGVERYRHLCSDANTLDPPDDRDAYRALIVRMATGEQAAAIAKLDKIISEVGTEPAAGGCCH